MNTQKLITALLLLLPGLSWGQVRIICSETPELCAVPEPSMLALLGAGGAVVGVVAFLRRKK